MWISVKRKHGGLTLIEAIIIVAILALLVILALVSVSQARRRARDTTRIADIQQIRNALLIYAATRATYPPGVVSLVLGGPQARCLDDSDQGFHSGKPQDPCGGKGLSLLLQEVPSEVRADHPLYTYRRSGSVYEMKFKLEGEIGNLSGGNCTATPSAITCP